jgi:hypothetical protein
MYGTGSGPGVATQPPPPNGRQADDVRARKNVLAVRVGLAALGFLTCGLLSWVGLVRLAVRRKRAVDWAVLALDVVLLVLAVALGGGDGPGSGFGTDLLIGIWLAAPAYFVAADIVHVRQLAAPVPTAAVFAPPPVLPPVTGAYGYPTVPAQPGPAAAGYGYPPVAAPPPPAAGQATGSDPNRIGQVRAELDELSDLLRREDGAS